MRFTIDQECSVGQDPGEATLSTSTGNYINLQYPALCSGNLTTWRYCYYSSSITEDETYTVIFRVWRPTGDGTTFDRIHDNSFSIPLTAGGQSAAFICDTYTESQYVPVEVNDVIGFFSTTFFGNNPLYITSQDVPDFTLFQDTRFLGVFATTVNASEDLNQLSLGLHLSADIGKL